MKFPVRLSVLRCVVACVFAIACAVRAEPPKSHSAVPVFAEIIYAPTDLAALRKRLNHRVVLEGKIVAMGKSRSGSTTYLNFTKNYHDSVSLVCLAADGAGAFTKERLSEFVGKKVHVGGLIEDRSGALQVRVFELGQIKVLP